MLTVKTIYEFCYPLLNKHWITYSLWVRWFLSTLEAALHSIVTYEWFLWKRQHYSEQISDMNLGEHRGYIRHQTEFPMLQVDRFWGGRAAQIDEILNFCDCPDDTPDDCICDQSCVDAACAACFPLKIKELLPHTKICKGSYKVAWSDTLWMWGEGWQVLHILPDPMPERIFVTYYRWFAPITSYNQVVPIPRHFINAIKYSIMMDIYVNRWVGGETLLPYFEQKFDKAMLWLKKMDTVMWSNIVRGKNDHGELRPFYWDSNSNNGR